jgi:membrane protease YdiL (CAAX protease family)
VYGIIVFTRKKSEDAKFAWTPLEAIAITLLIFFGGQLIAGFLAYVAAILSGKSDIAAANWLSEDALGQFLFIILNAIISVILLLAFLKRRSSSLKTIGFKRRPQWKDIAYAVLALIAYFAAYIAIVTLVKNIIPALDIEQEQKVGFESISRDQLPIVFISLVLIPPFLEETLVRGFLYTGLKKGMHRFGAVFITSILFAVAHLQFGSGAPLLWIAAIDTFVLSLFLIYLKDKTDSLWAPILLHMLKNFIAFMALFVL